MEKIKKYVCVFFLLLLLLPGVLICALPQKSFSAEENRTLTALPSFSPARWLDGSFQKQLEDALNDQLPLREKLMAAETVIRLAEGQRDIKDTYIGADHYYFEKVTDDDLSSVKYRANLKSVEKLAEDFPEISFEAMLVPSSGIILTDKLPANAVLYGARTMEEEAEEILTSVHVTDPTAALKKHAQGDQIFYRTDHHWTSYGAYQAYLALMGTAASYGPYEAESVTESFRGTLYSRTLDPGVVPDSIELPKLSDAVIMTAGAEETQLYDRTKLSVKDKYQVFEGGNFGRVDITGTGKGTLVLLKDSFANSLVPFLTADYARIIMIDLRYYPGTVRSLLQSETADEALVLYELNNFAEDDSVSKLSVH